MKLTAWVRKYLKNYKNCLIFLIKLKQIMLIVGFK